MGRGNSVDNLKNQSTEVLLVTDFDILKSL